MLSESCVQLQVNYLEVGGISKYRTCQQYLYSYTSYVVFRAMTYSPLVNDNFDLFLIRPTNNFFSVGVQTS